MTVKDKISFYVQYIIGRITVFIVLPLIVAAIKIANYRVKEMNRVREKVKKLLKGHPGPWLICPNHLTMIDSVIVAYAMIPSWRYLFQYRMLPWNVPETTNFKNNIFIVMICFLMKCIPVERGGDRGSVQSVLSKCNHLLLKGENLVIFPEGTRSRDGRVKTKEFPYSAGRFFLKIPNIRVMCIYLRGENQIIHSAMPRYGESFIMKVEEAELSTKLKGLRAQREVSGQIITQLLKMEEIYFDSRGK